MHLRGTFTDRSGSITVGGTSQQLAPVNNTRTYLLIQNQSTGDLWVNFTAAATTTAGGGSLKIPAGSSFVFEAGCVSTEAVNIIGATNGQAFCAKEG